MERMRSFSNIFDSAAHIPQDRLAPAGTLRSIPFKPDCSRARRMPTFTVSGQMERPFQAVLK
jgi:hypothetical protein